MHMVLAAILSHPVGIWFSSQGFPRRVEGSVTRSLSWRAFDLPVVYFYLTLFMIHHSYLIKTF